MPVSVFRFCSVPFDEVHADDDTIRKDICRLASLLSLVLSLTDELRLHCLRTSNLNEWSDVFRIQMTCK